MPDGDVIRRGVRHAWRGAYEGLAGGGADADVPNLVAKGLTASLRKRGAPPYSDEAALVEDAWNQRLPRDQALERVARTVGSIGGTREAALMDVAVTRAIIAGPTGASASQAVVEGYLNAEVDAELMAKVRPAMLEVAGADPAAVENTIVRWTDESQEVIRRIAKQLIDNPSAEELRAPRSRSPRKNTAQILDEAI